MSAVELLSKANKYFALAKISKTKQEFQISVVYCEKAYDLYYICLTKVSPAHQNEIKKTLQLINTQKQEIAFLAQELGVTVITSDPLNTLVSGLDSMTFEDVQCNREEDKKRSLEETVQKFKLMKSGNALTTDFKNIIGHGAVKRALFNAILPRTKFAPLVSTLGLGDQTCRLPNCLLYGHPGTGKTQLAKAFAKYTRFEFLNIVPSDILGSYVGESEKNLKCAFQAASSGPCVLFFDEIDGILSRRSENGTSLLNEFLTLAESDHENLIIMGATNYPFNLPDNVLRRFENKIYVSLPIRQERVLLLKFYMGNKVSSFTDEQYNWIASHTIGYSGCDLMRLVKAVKMLPLEKVQSATHFRIVRHDSNEPRWAPCKPDALNAVQKSYTSINPQFLEPPQLSYDDFKFGLKKSRRTTDVDDMDESSVVQKMIRFQENGKS